MLSREEKAKFVEEKAKELGNYKSIGVVSLEGIPDRLLQRFRNSERGTSKIIIERKQLLERVLKSNSKTEKLAKFLSSNSAIILSNMDPMELNNALNANAIELEAKPKKAAKEDIVIKEGETSLQPGQVVTELKQAGINVQLQKGKVVIGSSITIKKGDIVSVAMAKALHTLAIKPYKISIVPAAIFSEGIIFTKEALSITPQTVMNDIVKAFTNAVALSFGAKIVNAYTIKSMIADCYANAVALGISCNIYAKGITEMLLEKAELQAKALGSEAKQA